MLVAKNQKRRGHSKQESIHGLKRAIPGSTRLDLCASSYTILTPEMGPQVLFPGVFGLLKEGGLGLILGISSSTMQGQQVFPGVIDHDYKGEMKIMATAHEDIVTIISGQQK